MSKINTAVNIISPVFRNIAKRFITVEVPVYIFLHAIFKFLGLDFVNNLQHFNSYVLDILSIGVASFFGFSSLVIKKFELPFMFGVFIFTLVKVSI